MEKNIGSELSFENGLGGHASEYSCEERSCAIYSSENDLAAPPFTLTIKQIKLTDWLKSMTIGLEFCYGEVVFDKKGRMCNALKT